MPPETDSKFYDFDKDSTMQKLTTHTPSYSRSHPKQHPALTSKNGIEMNISSIDSCLSPIKVMDAKANVASPKSIFLSDIKDTSGRDLLLQKQTDLYDNVMLENTKEFRQLEL